MKKENAGKDINNSLYPIIPDDDYSKFSIGCVFLSIHECLFALLGCFLRESLTQEFLRICFEKKCLKIFKDMLPLKTNLHCPPRISDI